LLWRAAGRYPPEINKNGNLGRPNLCGEFFGWRLGAAIVQNGRGLGKEWPGTNRAPPSSRQTRGARRAPPRSFVGGPDQNSILYSPECFPFFGRPSRGGHGTGDGPESPGGAAGNWVTKSADGIFSAAPGPHPPVGHFRGRRPPGRGAKAAATINFLHLRGISWGPKTFPFVTPGILGRGITQSGALSAALNLFAVANK